MSKAKAKSIVKKVVANIKERVDTFMSLLKHVAKMEETTKDKEEKIRKQNRFKTRKAASEFFDSHLAKPVEKHYKAAANANDKLNGSGAVRWKQNRASAKRHFLMILFPVNGRIGGSGAIPYAKYAKLGLSSNGQFEMVSKHLVIMFDVIAEETKAPTTWQGQETQRNMLCAYVKQNLASV